MSITSRFYFIRKKHDRRGFRVLEYVLILSFFLFNTIVFAKEKCPKDNIICSEVNGKNGIILTNLAQNVFTCVITFQLNGKQLKKPYIVPVKPEGAAIVPVNFGNTRWTYYFYYSRGFILEKKTEDYVYLLPFPPGQSISTSKYSPAHKDYSRYAVDFMIPEGTPIHASRPGIVIAVKQDSNIGGYDPKFTGDGNFIEIQHSDGTIATYVHLRKDGSRVKVLQKIAAGELIGYSGNTGFSGGPHLHFHVYKPYIKDKDGLYVIDRQAIPFKFMTSEGIQTAGPGKKYLSPD